MEKAKLEEIHSRLNEANDGLEKLAKALSTFKYGDSKRRQRVSELKKTVRNLTVQVRVALMWVEIKLNIDRISLVPDMCTIGWTDCGFGGFYRSDLYLDAIERLRKANAKKG